MEIADVIAHAMHFRLLLSLLSHQQVWELGAILVGVQEGLAVQEVQEALVCLEDKEERQDHQRR